MPAKSKGFIPAVFSLFGEWADITLRRRVSTGDFLGGAKHTALYTVLQLAVITVLVVLAGVVIAAFAPGDLLLKLAILVVGGIGLVFFMVLIAALSVLWNIAWVLVLAGSVWVVLKLMRKGAGFEKNFYAMAVWNAVYSMLTFAAGIFFIIVLAVAVALGVWASPLAGLAAFGLGSLPVLAVVAYALFLMLIAIKQANSFNWTEAFIASLGPSVLVFFILIVTIAFSVLRFFLSLA